MKRKKMLKRFLSFILCFAMLLSAISGAVFADYYEVINDTLANPTLYGGVYANEKYILVGEGGSIYYSINATQWTKQPIVTNNTLNDIIYANDRFVIVGDNGTILTSFDGENWAERSSGVSSDLNAIMYVEEKYIVVGNNGTVLSSSDTGVWDLKTTNTNYNLNDIIFAKNTYIAVGDYGTIISSVNSNSWSILTSNTVENLYTVATDESLSASAENSRIVVGGANGTVLMSLNADSWAVQISPTAGTAIMGMTFYNSQFVLVGTSSLIMTSTDGVSWTSKFSQGVNDWYSVHYLNNKYFCLGSGCSVEYSSDGNSWSICNVGKISPLNDVLYVNNQFIAVGDSGTIVTSEDGDSWLNRLFGSNSTLNGIAYGNNIYVAVGNNGIIYTSPDSITWTKRTSTISESLNDICYSNDIFVSVGDNGTIITSSDGLSWSAVDNSSYNDLKGVCGSDTMFVAVGASGTILYSSDALNWNTSNTSGAGLYDIQLVDEKFVVVGAAGTIKFSTDCITWSSATVNTNTTIKGICPSQKVAVGNKDILGTNTLSDWSKVLSTKASLNSVAYGLGKYVGVGTDIVTFIADISSPVIALTEQSNYTSGNVTVNVSIDDESGIALKKWASGEQESNYFADSGTEFEEDSFDVVSNGIYTVYAKDLGGLETVETITVTKQDITPPSAPSWVQHYGFTGNPIVIIWNSVSDSALGGYNIYRDSQLVGTAAAGETSFSDQTPFNGSSTYSVAAFDKAGNQSTATESSHQSTMIIDGFYPGMTAENVRQNIVLNSDETVEIYDKDDTAIEDSALIGSQSKIFIKKNGEITEQYIVALYGDLNCDGLINNSDITEVRKYLLSNYDGKNISHVIADINWDKAFNIIDFIHVKKYVSNEGLIIQNRLGGTPARFASIVDSISPTVDVSVSQEWDTNNTITVTTSDAQSGIFIKEYSLEGKNLGIFSENTIEVSKNGNYTFTVYDYSGNATTAAVIVNHIIDVPVLGAYEKVYNDFEIPSKGIDIDLTRYYSSMNNEAGIFGKGWISTYEATCKDFQNDPSLNLKVVTLPGNKPILFTYENGSYTCGTSRMKLTNGTNGTFVLETPEKIRYTFNSDGQLITIVDKLDNTVTISLSDEGKIQSITDSVSRQYSFEYGNNGLVSKISDPSGRIFQYQYDSNNMLINIIDPMLTCTTQYRYNSDGYIAVIFDAFHNIIESVTYSSETSGRISSITDKDGANYAYTIDDTERKITITDIFEKSTVYSYDKYMQLISTTDISGTKSINYYNAFGDINTVTYSDSNTEKYVYDANGNILSVTYTNDGVTSKEEYTYDTDGNMLSSKDTDGKRKYYEYDSIGRLSMEITPNNGTDIYDEDTSDPDDFYMAEYEYYRTPKYRKNLVSGIYYSNDTYITYSYDNNGYLLSETTESGATSYSHNNIGWLKSEIKSGSDSINYSYNLNGNITLLQKGTTVITRSVYDTYGRIKQQIEGSEYSEEYDGLKKIPAIDSYSDDGDEVPVGTRYYYGNNEKLSHVKMSDYTVNLNSDQSISNVKVCNNALVSYSYSDDVKHLLEQTQYANGQSISYAYTDSGNIQSVTIGDDTSPAFVYSYNENDELTRKTDNTNEIQTDYSDHLVTVSKINDDSTLTVLHKYETSYDTDDISQFIETVGSNIYTVKHLTDEDKFVLNSTDSINKSFSINHQNGNLSGTQISKTVNNTTSLLLSTEYSYTDNKISSATSSYSGGSVQYGYIYNGETLTKITRNNSEKRYKYDAYNRLERVDDTLQSITTKYFYNGSGNIVSKKEYNLTAFETEPSALLNTQTFTYEDSDWPDKLTAVNGNTITYDDLGNPLSYNGWTYVWEAGRQLKRMSNDNSIIDYKYDDSGIRISKTINNVTTNYTTVDGRITSQNDGTNLLYFRYDHNNELVGFNLNGTEYLYLKNLQGDIEGILNMSGELVVSYAYDAWGKVLYTAGTLASTVGTINPMRYRDYYLDSETGYYYLQSRYYDPNICRFINADEPSVITLNFGTINGANLFAYCNDDPINNIDPTGYLKYYVYRGYSALIEISHMIASTIGYAISALKLGSIAASSTASGVGIVIAVAASFGIAWSVCLALMNCSSLILALVYYKQYRGFKMASWGLFGRSVYFVTKI